VGCGQDALLTTVIYNLDRTFALILRIHPPHTHNHTRTPRLMAGTSASLAPHVIGSTVVELSRTNRTGAPSSARISTKTNVAPARDIALAEGPSCIFVGPLETASKETLEALYLQVGHTALLVFVLQLKLCEFPVYVLDSMFKWL